MKKNPLNGFIKFLVFGLFILLILEGVAINRLTGMSKQVISEANGFDISSLALNMKDSIKKADVADAEKASAMDLIFNTHKDSITFLCKTFGADENTIKNNLKQINSDEKVNELNIGRIGSASFSSFDRGLVEYLFSYAEKNPGNINNTYVPYNGSSTYVENLIKYYTSLYPEVDYLAAISIGAAESGYYTVKFMLNKNNIYGGMGSGGLIQFKTIEYGTLYYIKYLYSNYYSKGVTSLEAIGKSYCPSTDSSGNRIASPHWINLINKAKVHYGGTTNNITATNLIS